MDTLQTAVMTVLWDELLRRISLTSRALQQLQTDVCTVPVLYSSLIEDIGRARKGSDVYEAEAKTLTATEGYRADSQRRRGKKVLFGGSAGPEVRRSGREAFLIDTHYVICDCSSQELKQRKDAYKNVEERFGFLPETRSIDTEHIRAATGKLKRIYPQDLEEDFTAELCQFISMVKDEESVMFKKLLERGLRDAFPNVDICLRMNLTLPTANCSGGRSFSLLERVERRATATGKNRMPLPCWQLRMD